MTDHRFIMTMLWVARIIAGGTSDVSGDMPIEDMEFEADAIIKNSDCEEDE